NLDVAYTASRQALPSELYLTPYNGPQSSQSQSKPGILNSPPLVGQPSPRFGSAYSAHGQLTKINKPMSESTSFSEQTEFKFNNEEFEVQGWLIPPINHNEKKKYPVILNIHGGPHG